MREFDDKDAFRMGDGFYIAFLYESGRAVGADPTRHKPLEKSRRHSV